MFDNSTYIVIANKQVTFCSKSSLSWLFIHEFILSLMSKEPSLEKKWNIYYHLGFFLMSFLVVISCQLRMHVASIWSACKFFYVMGKYNINLEIIQHGSSTSFVQVSRDFILECLPDSSSTSDDTVTYKCTTQTTLIQIADYNIQVIQ